MANRQRRRRAHLVNRDFGVATPISQKACPTGRHQRAQNMTRPDSKTYQTLPFAEQTAVILRFMADSGHAVTNADKFMADCCADRGRAEKRARITGTVWKTATMMPTAIRADYPRLVMLSAMEEAYLQTLKAENAVRAVNAME